MNVAIQPGARFGLAWRGLACSMIWVENAAYLVEIHPDHGNRIPE
jgi:hypothetical protein